MEIFSKMSYKIDHNEERSNKSKLEQYHFKCVLCKNNWRTVELLSEGQVLQLSVQEVPRGAQVSQRGCGRLTIGRQEINEFIGQLRESGCVSQTGGAGVGPHPLL